MRPPRASKRRRSPAAPAPWAAEPQSPSRSPARFAAAATAGLTLVAAALHLFAQSRRPLWLDEACTYWTVRHTGALDLMGGAGTDGTPPLHFLMVSAVTAAWGSQEFVLRLPSIVAATCLVPVVFAAARRLAGWRAGVIAAALAAVSPLVHYYAVEARSYALAQLETAGVIYAVTRAVAAPDAARWWGLVGAVLAIQLWTNSYAVFMVPVPVLAAALTASPMARRAIVARAAAATAIACLLWLPWLLQGLTAVRAGVADWIAPFWIATPPWAAIPRSLEVFGFGGAYPAHLGYLGRAPSARPLSIAVTLGLLLVAALAAWRRRAPRSRAAAAVLLFGFLLVPLAGAWAYSLAVRPLYLVGRYDAMVLPAFLILLAIGLDAVLERQRWLGTAVAAAIAALAALSLSTAVGPPESRDDMDRLAGQALARDAAPADRIVSTGSRLAVTAYYAETNGYRGTFSAFPPEIAGHPGWYSAERLLADRARLEREGEESARELVAAARRGARVWILDSTNRGINQYLFLPLLRDLEVDAGRSHKDLALICLKLH